MGERFSLESEPVSTVTQPLLELRTLAKRYGSADVFREINLRVGDRQHFAVLGPSGSGKSTLLRLIAGLEAPTQGEVWLHGQLASSAGQIKVPPHERRLSMVFQDLALWPNLTVLENVELGLLGARLTRVRRRERALMALRACHIDDLAQRQPASLSGGQQQRAALARALAPQPAVLLLDEPFSGLDIAMKDHICSEIRRLCEEFGVTVVLVSHDPLEAANLCSHAAVLENGRVQETGLLKDLLANPSSETLHAFVKQLAAAPGDSSIGHASQKRT